MARSFRPKDHLEDYRTYLVKKILRLKWLLDKGYEKSDVNDTLETLRQLEADLFKLKNVGTLIDMQKAA